MEEVGSVQAEVCGWGHVLPGVLQLAPMTWKPSEMGPKSHAGSVNLGGGQDSQIGGIQRQAPFKALKKPPSQGWVCVPKCRCCQAGRGVTSPTLRTMAARGSICEAARLMARQVERGAPEPRVGTLAPQRRAQA